MIILSASLKLKISNNPTNTIPKDKSINTKNEHNKLPKSYATIEIKLPDTFDGRKVWKDFLSPIRNQGKCGSCWAFSTVSCLEDRFAIQSGGLLKPDLSVAKMLLCDFKGQEFTVPHPDDNSDVLNKINADVINKGVCKGNTLYDAWRYLYLFGTCEDKCLPYDTFLGKDYKYNSLSDFEKNDKLPLCQNISGPIGDMCYDIKKNSYTGEEYGTPARNYRCCEYYSVPEDNIRYEIYRWGPITTAMVVYADFYDFDAKNDIYDWDKKSPETGGHAIEIVGWGDEKGKKYWIVKNTWGVDFGRNGYFYISRGNNCCGIEENVVAGIPDFFYPSNYNFPISLKDTLDPVIKNQRKKLDTDITLPGGGIDPETGYTRRIITTKPWVDKNRIIDLSKLPVWNNFIAGEENSGQVNTNKKHTKNIILIVSLFVLIIMILFIIYILLKKLK
jgi:hypothetical protein